MTQALAGSIDLAPFLHLRFSGLKGVFSPNPPFLLRYQGELLGLWDPQNRDLRRKLTPETKFSVGCLSPPSG